MKVSMKVSLVKLVCFISTGRLGEGETVEGIGTQIDTFLRASADKNEFGENEFRPSEDCTYKYAPLIFYVAVPKLPKNARVELHSVSCHSQGNDWFDSSSLRSTNQDDFECANRTVALNGVGTSSHFCALMLSLDVVDDNGLQDVCSVFSEALRSFSLEFEHVYMFNVYKSAACPKEEGALLEILASFLTGKGATGLPLQCLPVDRVGLGDEIAGAVVVEVMAKSL